MTDRGAFAIAAAVVVFGAAVVLAADRIGSDIVRAAPAAQVVDSRGSAFIIDRETGIAFLLHRSDAQKSVDDLRWTPLGNLDDPPYRRSCE